MMMPGSICKAQLGTAVSGPHFDVALLILHQRLICLNVYILLVV